MAIHTIGSTGDFATIQAWFDDIPATLTEQRIGRLQNQEFVFTGLSSKALTTQDRVTTPTKDIILECVPGGSFMDNANKRTNALRYNAANGAGIRSDGATILDLFGNINHITFRGIQIKQAAGALDSLDIVKCATNNLGTNQVFQDLIIEQTGSDNNDCMFLTGKSRVLQCLIIHGGNNPDGFIKLSDAAIGYETLVVGCTLVRPSNLTAGGFGLYNKLADPDNRYVAFDNIVCGAAAGQDGFQLTPGPFNGFTTDYNATNQTDVASGLPDSTDAHTIYAVVYDTTLFVQPSSAGGTHDYRLVAGSTPVNAGLYDGTVNPADITALTRQSPPEIGAWELSPPVVGGGFYSMWEEIN